MKDYKPPIPPHRNIGVTARSSLVESPPPPRKLHVHSQNRSSKHQLENPRSAAENDEYEDNPQECSNEKPLFKFDDEPCLLSDGTENIVKLRPKKFINNNDDNVQFVRLSSDSANGNGKFNLSNFVTTFNLL